MGFKLGNMGSSLEKILESAGLAVKDEPDADLMTHAVSRETHTFYRPADVLLDEKPKKSGEEEDEEQKEDEQLRPTGNAELTEAYYYGGTLVSTGDLEDGVGQLKGNKPGMEIISFVKQDSVRPFVCH
jgi:hypothetical protein